MSVTVFGGGGRLLRGVRTDVGIRGDGWWIVCGLCVPGVVRGVVQGLEWGDVATRVVTGQDTELCG